MNQKIIILIKNYKNNNLFKITLQYHNVLFIYYKY